MLKLDLILQIMAKNENVIRLMNWVNCEKKVMAKFVGLRVKTYSYLIDDDSEIKKVKDTKKCVIKRKPKFENYKGCSEATKLI